MSCSYGSKQISKIRARDLFSQAFQIPINNDKIRNKSRTFSVGTTITVKNEIHHKLYLAVNEKKKKKFDDFTVIYDKIR